MVAHLLARLKQVQQHEHRNPSLGVVRGAPLGGGPFAVHRLLPHRSLAASAARDPEERPVVRQLPFDRQRLAKP
eukprot:8360799-Pyramimonas_sp.AAC.1